MGQRTSRATSARERELDDEGGDDVKRQVDSDVSALKAIYQLVDVKTGGGKLIELVKSNAKRQSCSMNTTSSSLSSSSIGSFASPLEARAKHSRGPKQSIGSITGATSFAFSATATKTTSHGLRDDPLDEQIRNLVEPLLYNGGRGKIIPLRQLWCARFGYRLGAGVKDDDTEVGAEAREPGRLVCWRLEERGFVGETALHICFLLSTPSHMILAQKLLELFPMLIYDIYTCDEYFGESCLHMAIVNEDIRIVKWLLDRQAHVHERCLGSFFIPLDQKEAGRGVNGRARRFLQSMRKNDIRHSREDALEPNWLANEFPSSETNYEGYCYWGEYPLSFAASLGLVDCYRLLLAKGADPNRCDSNGNSTLHICVIANRVDMFDLCYSTGGDLNLINDQKLSPLALAAKLERVQMFFHILAIRHRVTWNLCGVCFQQIALAGMDSIDERDGSFNEHSLLCIVVSGSSNAHLSMLDGLLAELLQVKWRTSIELKFNHWFRCFLVFLATSWLAYVTRLASNSASNPQLRYRLYQARVISEVILVCFVLGYLIMLARRVFDGRRAGAASRARQLLLEAPELIMFTFTCFLILMCIPIRWARLEQLESALAATIIFLLPMKLLFFCRASRSLGSFIVMIYKILVNDVLCFVVFLIIFVAGFSQSFLIIFKTYQTRDNKDSTGKVTNNSQQQEGRNYFVNLFDGVISMHMMALNEFSLVVDQFDSTEFPFLARVLFCLYMILVSILLVNMLIAMLGKTYQDISSQPNENLRQWARALLSVERMCSRRSRLQMLDKYSHKAESQNGRRFYNSIWPLKSEQAAELTLVKQLRFENKANSIRLRQKQDCKARPSEV